MPIIVFLQYSLLPIGILLGDKFGAKFITGVGSSLMLLSYILIKVYPNYAFAMFSICLFGIGASLGFLYLIKNGWKYFPNKTGLVSGLILSGLGCSAVILNPIGDYIINSGKTGPDSDGYYPEKIGNSVNTYLIFIIILFIVLGILSVSLTFTYVPEDTKPNEINKDNKVVHNELKQQEIARAIPVVIEECNKFEKESNNEEYVVPNNNIQVPKNNKQEERNINTEEGEKTVLNDKIQCNIDNEQNPVTKQVTPKQEILTIEKRESSDKNGNGAVNIHEENIENKIAGNADEHQKKKEDLVPTKNPIEQENNHHIDLHPIIIAKQSEVTHELNSTLHTEITKEAMINTVKSFKINETTESITLALKSKKNILLFSITFIGPFFPILLTNTNRAFGNLNHLPQAELQIMSTVIAVFNFSSRFLWGFLIDRFRFKILMGIILCLELAISISVYFASAHVISYIIVNVFIGSCVAGVFTTLPPTFNRIFGVVNGARIFSYAGFLVGLSSLLGPVLTRIVIKQKNDYLIVYLTASGLIIIALVLLFVLDETPFVYHTEKEGIKNITHNMQMDSLMNSPIKQMRGQAKKINNNDKEHNEQIVVPIEH